MQNIASFTSYSILSDKLIQVDTQAPHHSNEFHSVRKVSENLSTKPYQSIGKTLPVKSRDSVEFVAYEDINFIEADNNYCIIHLSDKSRRVVSKCMKYILEMLDSTLFLKVHRKYAVNVDHVREINIRESQLHMRNDKTVNISRALKKSVKNQLLEAI